MKLNPKIATWHNSLFFLFYWVRYQLPECNQLLHKFLSICGYQSIHLNWLAVNTSQLVISQYISTQKKLQQIGWKILVNNTNHKLMVVNFQSKRFFYINIFQGNYLPKVTNNKNNWECIKDPSIFPNPDGLPITYRQLGPSI